MVVATQHKAIRPGYKQTEAGVLPEDWRHERIRDLASITTGNRNTQDRVDDGAFPFFVRSQTVERINSSSFDGEAVLTAGDGVGTGKVFHYINGQFDFHQRVYKISNFRPDCDGFFFYLYFSKYFYDRIMSMTAKSSVDSVRLEMIADMQIPVPPLAEQRAIASALSDADGLILSLDRLIAKKRNIRTAVRQQFLVGKQRLPGFSGKWEVKRLGDLCRSISDGTHFTPQYVNDGVPFYSVENVTADNFTETKHISLTEHRELIKRCKPEKGDILMTRIGSLGDTKLIDWDVDASIYVSLALLKVNDDTDARYLYFYTRSAQFLKNIEARALVNASPKKINMGDIGNVPIQVPPLPEQRAIASILGDIDAEIAALQTRRDKSEALKQGMMQQLLTGKIRLR